MCHGFGLKRLLIITVVIFWLRLNGMCLEWQDACSTVREDWWVLSIQCTRWRQCRGWIAKAWSVEPTSRSTSSPASTACLVEEAQPTGHSLTLIPKWMKPSQVYTATLKLNNRPPSWWLMFYLPFPHVHLSFNPSSCRPMSHFCIYLRLFFLSPSWFPGWDLICKECIKNWSWFLQSLLLSFGRVET